MSVLIRKYRVPAYRSRLWVIVSTSVSNGIEKIEDQIDKRIIDSKDKRATRAYMYAFEDHKGRYHIMVFFKHTAKPGEIAHEAKHALNVIFKWHGVSLSLTNDEPECYCLEWLTDRIFNTIKDFKKL
jgi:hypothetical protein